MPENLKDRARAHPHHERGDKCGDEDTATRGRQPVERKDSSLWRGMRNNRGHSEDDAIETSEGKPQSGDAIDPCGKPRCAPDRNEERKDEPRNSRPSYNGCMVFPGGAWKMGNVLTLRVENSLWFPHAQKQDEEAETNDRRRDINQPWAVKSGHQKLRDTEANA